MTEKLLEKYWDLAMQGGPDLEGFVKRAAADEFGKTTPDDITDFLRSVEEITIENIHTKASEGSYFAQMRDQVIEQTHEQIAELISKYGSDDTSS